MGDLRWWIGPDASPITEIHDGCQNPNLVAVVPKVDEVKVET
jgi:hypothetical protein